MITDYVTNPNSDKWGSIEYPFRVVYKRTNETKTFSDFQEMRCKSEKDAENLINEWNTAFGNKEWKYKIEKVEICPEYKIYMAKQELNARREQLKKVKEQIKKLQDWQNALEVEIDILQDAWLDGGRMKQLDKTVTYTVEMTETEHEAIRLLSRRVKEYESYVGGDTWKTNLEAIIGKEYTDAIVSMFNTEIE